MGSPYLKLVGVAKDAAPTSSPQPTSAAIRGGSSGLADAQLVAMARGGEGQAFEELYRRHASLAFNLAVRLQGSATDVEDLVHDAFLKAHGQLSDLRDAGAFGPWLGSIVVSLVRNRLRRLKLLRGLGVSAPEPVELESVASSLAGPQVRAELAQVYALLRLLPADERIAWTLRYVQSNRLEEVAKLTGCSLATAKRRIARAQRFIDSNFVASETSVESQHEPLSVREPTKPPLEGR